jgi:L-lactate dehydrogenase complex protein LldE
VIISLFITCYNDTLFPETGKAVVQVLERLGHTVEFRRSQTCCGQMHMNTGYADEAGSLMRKFIDDFRDADIICVPSASCVAMMRDQYPILAEAAEDPTLVEDVERILARVFEFSELLTDKLGVEDTGSHFPHRVTFHPSCHSLRSLKVGVKPYKLLQHVRGIDLVDLPDCDQCCGFGGTFSVKNPDVSAAMLEEKIAAVFSTGAEIVCAGDNSCLMHIFGGLHRRGSPVRTMHLAEILAAEQEGPGK